MFKPPALSPLPLAIFLPLIVGLPLLLRSRRLTAVLDAMPPAWLVGLQLYRVLGGTFLFSFARGDLAAIFALPSGIGDTAVGLLAVPVAILLLKGVPGSRALGIAWNILGIVDLVDAIAIGFLTAPGPFQLIVPDHPNAQLGLFPTVLIPAFAVPSAILLHALSIKQLIRLGRAPPQQSS